MRRPVLLALAAVPLAAWGVTGLLATAGVAGDDAAQALPAPGAHASSHGDAAAPVARDGEARVRLEEDPGSAEADRQTICGIVVDESGRPVPASVWVVNGFSVFSSVQCRPDGTFVLENRQERPDPVRVHPLRAGFEAVVSEASYPWGATGVRLVLRRYPSIAFVVTDAESGAPVTGYRVRVRGVGTGEHADGEHPAGRAIVDTLPRGAYRMRVEPTRWTWFPSAWREVIVGEGHPAEHRFTVGRRIERNARVVTADGHPVPDTWVQVLEPMHGVPVDTQTATEWEVAPAGGNQATVYSSARSDAAGTVRLKGPSGRPLAVRARGPGHVPAVVRDVWFAADSAPLVLEVARGATITGRLRPAKLLDQLAAMAPGGRTHPTGIRFVRGGESFPPPSSDPFPLDAGGRFTATGIGIGTFAVVLCRWQTRLEKSEQVTCGTVEIDRDGERRELDLDLGDRLLAEVTCRVLAGGEPWRGQVALHGDGGWTAAVTPDTEGSFTMFVPAGTYRLAVKGGVGAGSLTVGAGEVVSREFRVAARR